MSGVDWDLLASYAGLITLATGSVYAGAFGSLPNAKPEDGATPEDDEDEQDIERLSSEDAWLFPIIGSVTLLGLYTVVKYFGKEWINWLLGWYFSFAGVGSIWKSSISLVRLILGNERWKKFDKTSFVVRKGSSVLGALSCRTPSLALLPVAAIPSIIYTFSTASRKSVLLTDILSLSFSFNALSLLKIDSFKTGSILLSGLFFYDVWWVFGTEVMVKVATTLDVPIKLLWPKSMLFSDARGFTMLGLGDVVLPGTFIALALRYDYHRATSASPPKSFTKPYFYVSLIAYALGLAVTFFVMHSFQAAQPALLYLSPACILSFFLTAAVRGELKEAWTWSDQPEEVETVDAAISPSQVTLVRKDSNGPHDSESLQTDDASTPGADSLKKRKRKQKAT